MQQLSRSLLFCRVPSTSCSVLPELIPCTRCPVCGTYYRRTWTYEYLVNGTEDEAELRRLTPAEAGALIAPEAYERLLAAHSAWLQHPDSSTRRYAAQALAGTSLDAWEHLPDFYEEWKAEGRLPVAEWVVPPVVPEWRRRVRGRPAWPAAPVTRNRRTSRQRQPQLPPILAACDTSLFDVYPSLVSVRCFRMQASLAGRGGLTTGWWNVEVL